MRIALLHLDISEGPQNRNSILLQRASSAAADAGAKWIVTPETALQGYSFARNEKPEVRVQPSEEVLPFSRLAQERNVTIFLGCAEKDAGDGRCYNSCLVIGSRGDVIGRHRKMYSHRSGAEAWAETGTEAEVFSCGKINAGVLVCADAYFEEPARILKKKQADMILVPAAWPPGGCGGPPVNAWERCSRVSGLPICICNQTGNSGSMDMSQAESAVIDKGHMQFAYSGLRQAVLLFDWDEKEKKLTSGEFRILPI